MRNKARLLLIARTLQIDVASRCDVDPAPSQTIRDRGRAILIEMEAVCSRHQPSVAEAYRLVS
jgi:hypothetical protein